MRRLLKLIDADRVRSSIVQAEQGTRGEIRVSLSRYFLGDLDTAARRTFARLEMTRTSDRNGVLIFVVPSRRRVRVLGDQGIHHLVGQSFWDAVALEISEHFQAGRFTEGLEAGVRTIGAALAAHFPAQGANPNELADEVDLG
ncbi:MAG: TPM domain-containing protein [Holophagaceae bacterium]